LIIDSAVKSSEGEESSAKNKYNKRGLILIGADKDKIIEQTKTLAAIPLEDRLLKEVDVFIDLKIDNSFD